MISFKKIKKLFKKSKPEKILEHDLTHFYLNTGISHDYPNKWTVVHAFLDSASCGDYSCADFLKGRKVMSYSAYLRELSKGKFDIEDLGGCQITKSGIKAIVKALDILAKDATKLLAKFKEEDSLELYNIYRRAYFIIYARELDLPKPVKNLSRAA